LIEDLPSFPFPSTAATSAPRGGEREGCAFYCFFFYPSPSCLEEHARVKERRKETDLPFSFFYTDETVRLKVRGEIDSLFPLFPFAPRQLDHAMVVEECELSDKVSSPFLSPSFLRGSQGTVKNCRWKERSSEVFFSSPPPSPFLPRRLSRWGTKGNDVNLFFPSPPPFFLFLLWEGRVKARRFTRSAGRLPSSLSVPFFFSLSSWQAYAQARNESRASLLSCRSGRSRQRGASPPSPPFLSPTSCLVDAREGSSPFFPPSPCNLEQLSNRREDSVSPPPLPFFFFPPPSGRGKKFPPFSFSR